jgi:MoxR-like ATPase
MSDSGAAKVIEKIGTIGKSMKGGFIEREEVIDGLFTALLAKHHVLLLGPPGTAKSLIARHFASAATGGGYFQYLLTKFTVPEELFGPISYKGLKEDKFERVTGKKLPEAKVAFLDEIWKANSSILNSLLTAINERIFFNGTRIEKLPLEMVIGASNEYPEDSSLDALFDRFMVKYWVDNVSDNDLLGRVLVSPPDSTAGTALVPEELKEARDVQVNWNSLETDMLLAVKFALNDEGFRVSDRKWVNCVEMVKAQAILGGRDRVRPQDFTFLKNTLWDRHEDKQKVAQIIGRTADPFSSRAQEYIDQINVLLSDLPDVNKIAQGEVNAREGVSIFDKISELKQNFSAIKRKITKIKTEDPDNPKVLEAINEIEKAQQIMKKTAKAIVDFC